MNALPYYHRPVGTQPHMLGASRTQLTPLQRPLDLGQSRAASQNRIFTNGQQKFPNQTTQQYAYPLQRRNTGEFPIGNANGVSKDSEDLLRRKTPGGILNGAYDGTLAGQDERHASKHILLPASSPGDLGSPMSGVFNSMEQTLPLRSPGVPHGRRQTHSGSWLHQPQQLVNLMPNVGMNISSGQQNNNWAKQQFQQSQIDSMLNQIPMHYPQAFYQQSNQFIPSAMQPSPQTPSSPTVSNDHGPFGPYWPNGTYVPYRPAALRDPRYYPQTRSDWLGQTERGTILQNSGSWDPSVATPGLGSYPRMVNGNQVQTPNTPFEGSALGQAMPQFDPVFTPGPQSYGNQAPLPQQQFARFHQQPSGDYFSAPSGLPHVLPGSSGSSGQSVGHLFDPQGQFPALEVDSLAAKAQYRDEIFSWAQQVYKELIAFLHHTRKANQHNKHGSGSHQPSRPSIYPKPPRHPSQESTPTLHRRPFGRSSSASQASDRQNELGNARSVQPAGIGGPVPGLYHSKSSGWTSDDVNDTIPMCNRRHSYQATPGIGSISLQGSVLPLDKFRTLRRTSGMSIAHAIQNGHGGPLSPYGNSSMPSANAMAALEKVSQLCQESDWKWIPGMLLAGCLAYGLSDHQQAFKLYTQIIDQDPKHVEAISNLAATLLCMDKRQEAEETWLKAIRLRPSYFEAVEHFVGLLCGEQRAKEAVELIDFVESSLRCVKLNESLKTMDRQSEASSTASRSPCISEESDNYYLEFDAEGESPFLASRNLAGTVEPGFGSSGYAISGADNGRMLALIHAKGNMLYALGDNAGAAKAFENAVLIGAGRRFHDIAGLVKYILAVVARDYASHFLGSHVSISATDPILLPPDKALQTARLCFPHNGELPGLKYVSGTIHNGMARKAAIATTSNSLLSLAKIFQDGMNTNSPSTGGPRAASRVREILALYYLSLALQPSPSTANNVGILLASVQQSALVPPSAMAANAANHFHNVPGIVPGSGVALALAYYNYGLNLDNRHAHLYTNLGSLLKDIGQLGAAIKMYEQAVHCDPAFDIALANLANAVKDQGHIADAINYYRRAVEASPDFAEAVCGLANALNSVCSWIGRGGIAEDGGKRDKWHVDPKGMFYDGRVIGTTSSGWLKRVVDIVEKQLREGEDWGKGVLDSGVMEDMVKQLPLSYGLSKFGQEKELMLRTTLLAWSGKKWEGVRIVRLVERATRMISRQWYVDKFVKKKQLPAASYARPQLPAMLTVPTAPTVLPFHTFTCPMSAKQIRLISQRNGLRISCSTLRSPWLPPTVYPPPSFPNPELRVGYVSSDFNNHPLAHLMQSVFGLHNAKRVRAYCYATTQSDRSIHRQQIEHEAPVFHDASSWATERLVNQIVQDGIHILVNLNGYTRGARNEVFAARPAPIQMSFMGFAGTLGAEWCDYLLADDTAVPLDTLRPWRGNVSLDDQTQDGNSSNEQDDWVYGENIIFCRDTFFCCDHRQSAPDSKGKQLNWEEEQGRRWAMRKELFPNLSDDTIILGNFNQLYKIEPTTFRTWLRILSRVPNAILWLLRFPDLGESHLKQTAIAWAGKSVAERIIFTDVAPKATHIARARVCDLFLDTPECNAHTTAADVLWSGTPLLTLPRYGYKMCSRMAASILIGALPKGKEGQKARTELVAGSEDEYEDMAVYLAGTMKYSPRDGAPFRSGGPAAMARRLSSLVSQQRNGHSAASDVPATISSSVQVAVDGMTPRPTAQSMFPPPVMKMTPTTTTGPVKLNPETGKLQQNVGANMPSNGHRQHTMVNVIPPKGAGRLFELRKLLYGARWSSALFDTKRWVRDLEDAYEIAWDRWVEGVGGDIFLKDERRKGGQVKVEELQG
ncbi:glycosyltransferase family 41 protein [Viridothelium virens]|uniref:protein O-GlcNAc transferase n=1 Tax=Viridothelium virens TaxID=1048519 RepID=A0A6A6H364_VIRVR|nr:glycosyltransferase family 41 protein [Viridothelium virens]